MGFHRIIPKYGYGLFNVASWATGGACEGDVASWRLVSLPPSQKMKSGMWSRKGSLFFTVEGRGPQTFGALVVRIGFGGIWYIR